jgi:hypothetical protein
MPTRDTGKLKALRAQVKAGTDALERGDFTRSTMPISSVISNG